MSYCNTFKDYRFETGTEVTLLFKLPGEAPPLPFILHLTPTPSSSSLQIQLSEKNWSNPWRGQPAPRIDPAILPLPISLRPTTFFPAKIECVRLSCLSMHAALATAPPPALKLRAQSLR